VHAVVPIEPAKRIASAIHVVDTVIFNYDLVAIIDPIICHSLNSHRSIERRSSPGRELAGRPVNEQPLTPRHA
jgi:hypothetical protein